MKSKIDKLRKDLQGTGKIITFMNMIRKALNVLRSLMNKDMVYTFMHQANPQEIKTLMNSLCITFWMEAEEKDLTGKGHAIVSLVDEINGRKSSKVSISMKTATQLDTAASVVTAKGKKIKTDPDQKAFRNEGTAAKFLSTIYLKVSPIINSFLIAMNKAVKAQSNPNSLLKESMEQLQELENIMSILENYDQAYVLLEHMLNNLEGENEMSEKNLLDLKVISESPDDEFDALLDKLIAESAKVEEVEVEESKIEAVTLTPEQLTSVMESEDPKAALAAIMAPPAPEPVAESAGPEKVLEAMKAVLEAEDPAAALAKFMEDVNAGTIKTEVPTAANLSPPGGRNETPTGKPYDKQAVPIPGGDSETPKSKPYDAMKLSIPAGSDISASTYNEILNRLQKSYKDNAMAFEHTIEMLRGLRPVDMTLEEEQANFESAIMEEAVHNSWIDGPLYEKADIANKDAIKKIVSALRKEVTTYIKGQGHDWTPSSKIITFLRNLGAGMMTRTFQILGEVEIHTAAGNANELIKGLNEEYKEKLGEFRIFHVALPTGGVGSTTKGSSFFLIIDKSPKEFKSELKAAIREKKDGALKESFDATALETYLIESDDESTSSVDEKE